MPEERAEALRVARLGVLEVAHRPVGHEEREQRPDALDATERRQALLEERRARLELVVDGRIAQPAQHRETGSRRKRVPGESPGLVDGTGGREEIHDLRPAAEGRERQAAADDLAEHRQVREYAEALLGAAARDAEAGDHLVEDQEHTRDVAEPAQRLQVAGLGRDDAHVRRDRFDDDRSEPFAVAHDRLRRGVEVVVRNDDRVGGGSGRHPRRRRDSQRREPGACAREQRVGVAVVAPGRLEDPVALGECAREPQRAHAGLGAGRDEPHLLHRRHGVGDLRGELHLGLGRGTEARPVERRLTNDLDRLGIGVAEEEGPPRHDPVEQPSAVLGLDVRALAALDEQRLVEADRAHRPHGRVHAAGDQLERAAIELRALGQSHAGRSRVQ